MDVTSSFIALLAEFRSVFTAPTFRVFVQLMTGWVLSHHRRFVTELILASVSVDKQESSFADMLTTLRSLSWREKFRTLLPKCTPRNKVINQMIEFAARAA